MNARLHRPIVSDRRPLTIPHLLGFECCIPFRLSPLLFFDTMQPKNSNIVCAIGFECMVSLRRGYSCLQGLTRGYSSSRLYGHSSLWSWTNGDLEKQHFHGVFIRQLNSLVTWKNKKKERPHEDNIKITFNGLAIIVDEFENTMSLCLSLLLGISTSGLSRDLHLGT